MSEVFIQGDRLGQRGVLLLWGT